MGCLRQFSLEIYTEVKKITVQDELQPQLLIKRSTIKPVDEN